MERTRNRKVVEIRIPPFLASLLDASQSDWLVIEREIADGATVSRVLAELAAGYPKFKTVVFNPDVGQPGDQVIVTINKALLQRHELAQTTLQDGDVIIILPIYSGG